MKFSKVIPQGSMGRVESENNKNLPTMPLPEAFEDFVCGRSSGYLNHTPSHLTTVAKSVWPF